jgi:hypothetical protein
MGVIVTNQLAQGFPQSVSFNTSKTDRCEWASYSEYQVVVGAVAGAPTTAVITAKFQVWVPNTTHNSEEDTTGTYFDLAPDTDPGVFPDGEDWPIRLADETTVTAVRWTRRISTSMPHRVAFTFAFTGGTTPSFPITVIHTLREGS